MQINFRLAELDKLVKKKRTKDAKTKDSKSGNTFHPSIQGAPKERDLPRPHKSGVKIPKDALDDDWLAAHPEQNHPGHVDNGGDERTEDYNNVGEC